MIRPAKCLRVTLIVLVLATGCDQAETETDPLVGSWRSSGDISSAGLCCDISLEMIRRSGDLFGAFQITEPKSSPADRNSVIDATLAARESGNRIDFRIGSSIAATLRVTHPDSLAVLSLQDLLGFTSENIELVKLRPVASAR